MLHVGNDIVDLADPANAQKIHDRRYIDRVLLPGEKALLPRHTRPCAVLWALWAAKESAYKALGKSRPVASSPLGCRVTPEEIRRDRISGKVCLSGLQARFRADIAADYVHCVCVDGGANPGAVNAGIAAGRGDESARARAAAIAGIAGHFGYRIPDIEIRRDWEENALGPPAVYLRGRRISIDLSLSHDGRFAAYAFLP